MLVLTALNNLLQQTLSLPSIHTAVLITCQGQLVSTAHDPSRSKDEIRIVVGLCAEVWRETGQQKPFAMLDSEYGHILVLPVDEQSEGSQDPAEEPFMLLALNGTSTASWDDLKSKASVLAMHLAKPLRRYRGHLISPTAKTSPTPAPPSTPDKPPAGSTPVPTR